MGESLGKSICLSRERGRGRGGILDVPAYTPRVRGLRRDEVQRLLAEGAQLVEVLPRPEYEEEHLPGAINIPLKELNRETASVLRRDQPVIVYCHDYQ